MPPQPPNVLLIAIDSLLSTHMSCYGYRHQTTPHIDEFSRSGALFENTYSAHIPTTPAYASMLTGRDCFGTETVALRHKGDLTPRVRTLAEILRDNGYASTCVGFTGNPSARGFDTYLDYPSWGNWNDRPLRKAEHLNEVTVPELERLQADGKPWFVMLRHMDPHAPYLPPSPFDRMFYHGNEFDPENNSMDPVFKFKPFKDFFRSWMPPGLTDKEYVIAQYDGAVAYMDSCIQALFNQLDSMEIAGETIVILNGDHGETLYDHECWFDHHGIYDVVLKVPLIIRYPGHVPAGTRVPGYNQHKDLVPTILELAGLDAPGPLDGTSLMELVRGEKSSFDSEFYITECTWMRKHGWRTPQWKLIEALEPDFHFKPPVELYNLVEDPDENINLADAEPKIVQLLKERMSEFIARREEEQQITNPMLTQGAWHGIEGIEAFESSRQAYDNLHIGDPSAAKRLQEEAREK